MIVYILMAALAGIYLAQLSHIQRTGSAIVAQCAEICSPSPMRKVAAGAFLKAERDVRFTPKSGHVRCNSGCPLCANSGRTVRLRGVTLSRSMLAPKLLRDAADYVSTAATEGRRLV